MALVMSAVWAFSRIVRLLWRPEIMMVLSPEFPITMDAKPPLVVSHRSDLNRWPDDVDMRVIHCSSIGRL
jgi:hypothetical protein